ncbi:hypothetical protein ACIRF8_15330 [Streptomyces sp. NPDC102406]|uniref:hypothetical protein n=1 Tax=Streptomyces sp. NPDC102406 TaxID=3366171 RepID=UPI0038241FA7
MTAATETPARTILRRFPAGAPRGSWPAEEFAARLRAEGQPVEVVLDFPSDDYLVFVRTS